MIKDERPLVLSSAILPTLILFLALSPASADVDVCFKSQMRSGALSGGFSIARDEGDSCAWNGAAAYSKDFSTLSFSIESRSQEWWMQVGKGKVKSGLAFRCGSSENIGEHIALKPLVPENGELSTGLIAFGAEHAAVILLSDIDAAAPESTLQPYCLGLEFGFPTKEYIAGFFGGFGAAKSKMDGQDWKPGRFRQGGGTLWTSFGIAMLAKNNLLRAWAGMCASELSRLAFSLKMEFSARNEFFEKAIPVFRSIEEVKLSATYTSADYMYPSGWSADPLYSARLGLRLGFFRGFSSTTSFEAALSPDIEPQLVAFSSNGASGDLWTILAPNKLVGEETLVYEYVPDSAGAWKARVEGTIGMKASYGGAPSWALSAVGEIRTKGMFVDECAIGVSLRLQASKANSGAEAADETKANSADDSALSSVGPSGMAFWFGEAGSDSRALTLKVSARFFKLVQIAVAANIKENGGKPKYSVDASARCSIEVSCSAKLTFAISSPSGGFSPDGASSLIPDAALSVSLSEK